VQFAVQAEKASDDQRGAETQRCFFMSVQQHEKD
jgi:hypothetical protein